MFKDQVNKNKVLLVRVATMNKGKGNRECEREGPARNRERGKQSTAACKEKNCSERSRQVKMVEIEGWNCKENKLSRLKMTVKGRRKREREKKRKDLDAVS